MGVVMTPTRDSALQGLRTRGNDSGFLELRKAYNDQLQEAQQVPRSEQGLPKDQQDINRKDRVFNVRLRMAEELNRIRQGVEANVQTVNRTADKHRAKDQQELTRAWSRVKELLDADYALPTVVKNADVPMLDAMMENLDSYFASRTDVKNRNMRNPWPDNSQAMDQVRRKLAEKLDGDDGENARVLIEAEDTYKKIHAGIDSFESQLVAEDSGIDRSTQNLNDAIDRHYEKAGVNDA
jgi:hypothetical protein